MSLCQRHRLDSHTMLGNPNQLTATNAAATAAAAKAKAATNSPLSREYPLSTTSPIIQTTSEAKLKASNTPNNLIGKMINDVSKTINSNTVRIAAPATTTTKTATITRPTTTIAVVTTTTTTGGLSNAGDFPSHTDTDTTAGTATSTSTAASATDVSKTTTETTVVKAALVRTTTTTTATAAATTTSRAITSEGASSPSTVSKLTTIQKKQITSNAMRNYGEPRPTQAKSTENKCQSKELTKVSIQRELEAISSTARQQRRTLNNKNKNDNNNVGPSKHNKWTEEPTSSIRCKPLELKRINLPGIQKPNIPKTKIPSLAERKAKLKLDFFKDTNSIEVPSGRETVVSRTAVNRDKHTALPSIEVQNHRLLQRNTSNLRLKLFKQQQINIQQSTTQVTATTVLPSNVLDIPAAAAATEQLSLVAQRKLDLKRRFEQAQTSPLPTYRESSTSPAQTNRSFPRVEHLVQKFDNNFHCRKSTNRKMIVNSDKVTAAAQSTQMLGQLKPDPVLEQRNSPLSDEGCNLGQSPYSSDNEDNESIRTASTTIERFAKARKDKVARSASSDSALGLEVDDPMLDPAATATLAAAAAITPNAQQLQQRRMTLTVTDLPLRPALLPLAEPTALPDSPTTSLQQTLQDIVAQSTVPSKVLLEERVIEIPEDPRSIGCSLSSSRRESAQSYISDYPPSECGGVRFVRTPSVVVSDYSDDVMCGITLEEIEYFRAQRLRRRRSSLDTAGGTEKETGADGHSDVSASSSCSNLYYCGSTISALDGAECYVNGTRLPLERKTSDCSTCSAVSGEEDESANFSIPEQPEDACQMGKDLADLLAAQHLSSKRAKKVGLTLPSASSTLRPPLSGVEKSDI